MPSSDVSKHGSNVNGSSESGETDEVSRKSHPRTENAFVKRLEAVIKHGRALTPQQTQEFRNPSLCNFDRLAQPKQRPLSREDRVAVGALLAVTRGRSASLAGDRRASGGTSSGGGSRKSPRRTINDSLDTMTSLSPTALQHMRDVAKRQQCIAVQWPPKHSLEYAAYLQDRLDPQQISGPLRRAVYGSALDRALQQSAARSSRSLAVCDAPSSKGTTALHDGEHELHVTLDVPGVPVAPSTKRNKNNNIFEIAAQELLSGNDADDVAHSTESATGVAQAAAELQKMSDAAYRKTISSIGHREYSILRALFVDLDDKREGSVELSQVLLYHQRFPRRLGRDVLDHLRVELDSRIYLDELIRVHFPSIPPDSIEQLIDLYEPKVQSIDALQPQTLKYLDDLYHEVMRKFGYATFANWLATRSTSSLSSSGTAQFQEPPSVRLATSVSSKHDDAAGAAKSSASGKSTSASEGDGSSNHGMDEDRLSHHSNDRHSLMSRSEPPSARGSARRKSSISSTTDTITPTSHQAAAGAAPTMNAMQLLLHLQQTSNISAKDLSQLYRLKHLTLRPNYSLQLSRAIRRAVATSRYGGGAVSEQVTVTEPNTNTQIPLCLLQNPFQRDNGEPSFPYLTNCPVRLHDFAVLLMDYFVLKQNNEYVEPYDPQLKAYLDQHTWEKLFPFTGPVRNYFKQM